MAAVLAAALLSSCSSAPDTSSWKRAGDRIMTEWGENLDPSDVGGEYPRPQLFRPGHDNWRSLNGLWNYALTGKDAAEPSSYDGQILVPFALESALSGVGKRLTPEDALWYETTFSVPRSWKNKRVRLNFEAVDYSAEVFVNGSRVGSHTGGYTHFSFDVTPYLKGKGEQTLVVKVLDATDDNTQPRGKQVSNPGGIWYTSVSGIWQTVWLEPVAEASIQSYVPVAEIGRSSLTFDVDVAGAKSGDTVEVKVREGAVGFNPENSVSGGLLAMSSSPVGKKLVVTLNGPDVKLWSPDNPYLYSVEILLKRDNKTLDRVEGYAAMREVGILTDADGHKRISLNGESLFQLGPLDQGWWPDGLYTAPTDEALRFDVEKTKDLGYNMIRKHIKVEPQRWYYYCDAEGILVWQDMPSITDSRFNKWATRDYTSGTDWDAPQKERDTYYKEWGEIIDQLKFHPSIVVWVPFNEAWAQFETEKAVAFTKEKDPTRLVNPSSGGNFVEGLGDILDNHHYPNPAMYLWNPDLVNVLGEYGGIGLPLEGHLWQADRNWGYVQYKNGEEVLAEYEKFADELIGLIKDGCAAAVYTQTTDVEIEVNGLMTYDRKVVKMDQSKLRDVNRRIISAQK
ncbi:MAG: beta galactosidase jelly roll domain-containing protein [Bacteroidales bacterium]|nr:beta galactosidase jelly roll domain-containing protein [Bacteroidales bacterium]